MLILPALMFEQRLTAQVRQTNLFAAFINPRKRVAFTAHETRELTHGDAEHAGGTRHVVATRDDDIERFTEQRWVIFVLSIYAHLFTLTTLAPERTRLVPLTRRVAAHLARQLQSQTKDRDVTVLSLAASLDGRDGGRLNHAN